MKRFAFILIYLISFISKINASDTLNLTLPSVKNNSYSFGLFICPFSITRWTNTQGYHIEKSGTEGEEGYYSFSFGSPKGLSFSWNFSNDFYLQTGLIFSEEHIESLGDRLSWTPYGSNRSTFLKYKIQYLQIPIILAYISPQKRGVYFAIGIKNNFAYCEHLYGTVNRISYDENSHKIKMNITTVMNFGGKITGENTRVNFLYFVSVDTPQIYQDATGIANFRFLKFSFLNLALTYGFK
jgi:hypothetical protein